MTRRVTRAEVLRELRERGYDGPASRTLPQLLDVLRGMKAGSEGPTTRPPVGGANGHGSHLDRVLEWGGLDRSVEFQVVDEPGWFRFMAHVTNTRTGDHWVDAYGGAGRHRQHRAFRVERVKVRNGKPVTRPSRRAEVLETEET